MTDQEALEAIELICSDDFCEDQSMQNMKRRKSALKTAVDKLSAIYRIAHSFGLSHECFYVHDDWWAEAERTHSALDF